MPDNISTPQDTDGKIAIFGQRISCKSTGSLYCIFTKIAYRPWYNSNAVKMIKGTTVEILRGCILDSLPFREYILFIADLYVARHGSYFRICEIIHHLPDRVRLQLCVRIYANKIFTIG